MNLGEIGLALESEDPRLFIPAAEAIPCIHPSDVPEALEALGELLISARSLNYRGEVMLAVEDLDLSTLKSALEQVAQEGPRGATNIARSLLNRIGE